MNDPRLEPNEQEVVQAALAAGYLTPADVEAAIAMRNAQRRAGQAAQLLPILAQRLSPQQLGHLRQVHHRSGTGRLSSSLIESQDGTRRIGRYTVIRELGEGGMGAVYLAREPELDREVALKVVLPGADAQTIERTRIEAQAAAKLDHPGIVRLHTVERDHTSRLVIALEVIKGGSLHDRLKREGPLPPQDAVELMAKVAHAIEYAHVHGILHRDLKPANILLTEDGEPKVTDFGLAKEQDDDQGLTKTGVVMGSPGYMSPEQGAGERERIDDRTDVYGLGATLFALLTGRPPFQGSLMTIIAGLLTKDAPRVRSLRKEIDPTLDRIVADALAREPEERTPTAGTLAEQLDAYLAGERAPRRPPLVAMLVVTVLALAGALAAVLLIGRDPPPQPEPVATASPTPTATATAVPVVPDDPDTWPVRVALDGPTLMSDRLPGLEVWGTRMVSRDGEGVRFRSTGQSSCELVLPLEFTGGPFQIELEGKVVLLERGNRFSITLHPWPDEDGPEWPQPLAFALRGTGMKGHPPEDAWWTPLLFTAPKEIQNLGRIARTAAARLAVKLRYDPATSPPGYHLSVQVGDAAPTVRTGTLHEPLPDGPYRVRLGANLRPRTRYEHGYRGHPTTSKFPANNVCDLREVRLRIRALAPKAFKISQQLPDDSVAQQGRLRRSVVSKRNLEATAKALHTYATGGTPPGLPKLILARRGVARFALIHAYEQLGRIDDAARAHTGFHVAMKAQSGRSELVITNLYHQTWARDLIAADGPTLDALAKAYPSWELSPEDDTKRISRLFERLGHPKIPWSDYLQSGVSRPLPAAAVREAVRARKRYLLHFRLAELLVLTRARPGQAKPNALAKVWSTLGDPERALKLMASAKRLSITDSALIGLSLFRLARYAECVSALDRSVESGRIVGFVEKIYPIAKKRAAR